MPLSVALTASQRSHILALRDVETYRDQAMTSAKTTSKSSSLDNPRADQSASLNHTAFQERADLILARKENVDQSITTLESSMQTMEAVDDILKQMKDLAENSRTQSTLERTHSTGDFNRLGSHIGQLVNEANYQGLNMLDSTSNILDIRFSDLSQSRLVINGYDLAASKALEVDQMARQLFSPAAYQAQGEFNGLSALAPNLEQGFSSIGSQNSHIGHVTGLITKLDTARERLSSFANQFSSNIAFLATRSDYAAATANQLANNAQRLKLADMNEEGARLIALHTSQQLAMQGLQISGNNDQKLLALVG